MADASQSTTHDGSAGLGTLLRAYVEAVPDGVLVFVPSYHVLKATKARWEQTGAYAAIQRHKLLVFEPRSGGDEFDRVLDDTIESRVRMEIDRIELHRRKSLSHRRFCRLHHCLRRRAPLHSTEADLISAAPSKQLPHRHLKLLSLDVPERHIDSADGAGQNVASERTHTIEMLPVMFDSHRILTDEVILEGSHHRLHRFGIAPTGSLSQAGETSVGMDADDVVPMYIERFDSINFHVSVPFISMFFGSATVVRVVRLQGEVNRTVIEREPHPPPLLLLH